MDRLYYVQEMAQKRKTMEERGAMASERGSAVVLKSLCGFDDGNRCRSGASERQKMLRQNAKSSQDNCGLSDGKFGRPRRAAQRPV